jgi:signal peptidase I
MKPTIIAGDYILVNKLAYGARISKNFKFMKDGGTFKSFRVKGFSKVKRNDVLVFNYPYTDWNKLQPDLGVYYLKRCVALPGDTFQFAGFPLLGLVAGRSYRGESIADLAIQGYTHKKTEMGKIF